MWYVTKPLSKLIYNLQPFSGHYCAFGFMKTGAALCLLPTDFIALHSVLLCRLFPFSAIKAANDKNVNHVRFGRIPLNNGPLIRQSYKSTHTVYAKCSGEKKATTSLQLEQSIQARCLREPCPKCGLVIQSEMRATFAHACRTRS